jgi:hypothetical protein
MELMGQFRAPSRSGGDEERMGRKKGKAREEKR